jgi:hypothetical protein
MGICLRASPPPLFFKELISGKGKGGEMKKMFLLSFVSVALLYTLVVPGLLRADVPPPPANQILDITEGGYAHIIAKH